MQAGDVPAREPSVAIDANSITLSLRGSCARPRRHATCWARRDHPGDHKPSRGRKLPAVAAAYVAKATNLCERSLQQGRPIAEQRDCRAVRGETDVWACRIVTTQCDTAHRARSQGRRSARRGQRVVLRPDHRLRPRPSRRRDCRARAAAGRSGFHAPACSGRTAGDVHARAQVR